MHAHGLSYHYDISSSRSQALISAARSQTGSSSSSPSASRSQRPPFASSPPTAPVSRSVSNRGGTPPHNREREPLLPLSLLSSPLQHAASCGSSAASASPSRARRFQLVAVAVIVSVSALLLLAHQTLVATPVAAVTVRLSAALGSSILLSHLHNGSASSVHLPAVSASSSSSSAPPVDRLSILDEGGDISITYSPTLIDALPFASASPLDSAATLVRLHLRFSDLTSAVYPVCAFRRVCVSSSYVLLSFSNLTVHSFYSLVLPRCHTERLYGRFELCRCFHFQFRPGVMPFAWQVTEEERRTAREQGRALAMQMLGGEEADWQYEEQQEIIKEARGFPTLQEMQAMAEDGQPEEMQSVEGERLREQQLQQRPQTAASSVADTLGSWYQQAHRLLSSVLSPSSSPSDPPPFPSAVRLYRSPFTYPARSLPPPSYENSSAASLSVSASSPNLTLHRYSSHYWSVHGWVDHHHIAHWAQKQLVMQATLSHYAHACSGHRYHIARQQGRDETGVDGKRETCAQDVRELVDVADNRPRGEQEAPLQAGEWRLECLPPVAGLLFHAFSTPPTEHEASIQQIAVEAMREWVGGMDDERQHEAELHGGHTAHAHFHPAPLASDRVAQLFPACCSDAPNPPAAASSLLSGFSTHHNIHSDFLFRQYSSAYDARRHPRHLPAATNHSLLSCFDHLSFSPLYGRLALSAYDMAYWRRAAQRHFAFPQPHSHRFTAVAIPLLSLPSTLNSSLPVPPFPLPASSRVDHTISSALQMLRCPPFRAVFVTRPDRDIVNRVSLAEHLQRVFNLRLDFLSVSASTPSSSQAASFHGAGLILSAHSSQLINTLFSSPSAAVIEISPELYNLDFAHYAADQGLFFRYAFGGEVQRPEDSGDKMRHCVAALRAQSTHCAADPFCVERVAAAECWERTHFPNKGKAFIADVKAVERAVRQALGYLMSRCYGRWGSIQLTRLSTA